jgi:hypothetical protein
MRNESLRWGGYAWRRYPDSKRVSDAKYFRRTTNVGGKSVCLLLHRSVWEFHRGPIPDGYHVHHKDENTGNNEIENLECILGIDHLTRHMQGRLADPDFLAMVRENAAKARPLTKAWHASPEGHEWHRQHSIEAYANRQPTDETCRHCGKQFSSISRREGFCSNACKTRWRFKSGIDDIDKTCPVCSRVFRGNKYVKSVSCSRACGAEIRRARSQGRVCDGGSQLP